MHHAPAAPTTTTAQTLDDITSRIDRLRADLSAVIRHMPLRDLPTVAAVDAGDTRMDNLVDAVQHLRQAAVALDRAADQIDAGQPIPHHAHGCTTAAL